MWLGHRGHESQTSTVSYSSAGSSQATSTKVLYGVPNCVRTESAMQTTIQAAGISAKSAIMLSFNPGAIDCNAWCLMGVLGDSPSKILHYSSFNVSGQPFRIHQLRSQLDWS